MLLFFQMKIIQKGLLILVLFIVATVVIVHFSDDKKTEVPRVYTPGKGIIMTSGMEITVGTSSEKISIKAGEGLQRIYKFDGCERELIMWPRTEEWYGKWGAYYPGPGLHWKDCNGIGRAVVEESTMHFTDEKDAVNYIKETYKAWNLVYSNDGLVVAWWKVPERHQLAIDVIQILIGENKKPTILPGANDSGISVTRN